MLLQKVSQWGREREGEGLGAMFGKDEVISIISGLNTPEKTTTLFDSNVLEQQWQFFEPRLERELCVFWVLHDVATG